MSVAQLESFVNGAILFVDKGGGKTTVFMSAPRLEKVNYYGSGAYFITVNCYKRTPYFENGDHFNPTASALGEIMEAFHFQVYAYYFMPDHLHLLLIGSEKSSLLEAISRFKQLTAFYFRQRTGLKL